MSSALAVETTILHRRSIKPAQMNGNKIQDDLVDHLLEMANWAPTHGLTEPWFYLVFSGEKVQEFCFQHAQLYKNSTPSEKYTEAAYEKILHNGDKASHILAAIMKRGDNQKIPEQEEMASVAASIQNILLTATAHGIASFWSTSGMTYQQAMKDFLQLRPQDKLMGFIFLGYSDLPFTDGKRMKSHAEKSKWA
ncbi:MAG: nitroreductase [Bacteroidetes bacterium]|nr:MAG: nitroreductase [Bacteroidota bacterium]